MYQTDFAELFKNCTNLESVSIPQSVLSIEYRVFDGCGSLKDIYYSGTKNAWNSISIHSNGNYRLAAVTIHCTDGDIVPNTENSITTGTASTSDSKFQATLANAKAGKEYVVLVSRSGSDPLNADNLLYINQITADADGELAVPFITTAGAEEMKYIVACAQDAASVDPDQPVEPGQPGEICVRGKNVMVGYYNEPEATAAAFDGDWFLTGDYGYINEKDQLIISGRKKNVIVLNNGKNIYPEEIEGYIQDIDYVNEVIVSGEKDKDGNESSLTAEVYLEEKKTPSEVLKSIKKACVELPIYKQITKVKIRDSEFPKTSSNKIKRFFKETSETVKEKTESMLETVSEKYNEYKENK